MKKAKIAAPAAFTITKTEPDKMLVFGWSNVAVDADGRQIEDLQGDMIDPEELEKAAYNHVLHFRAAGEKHDPGLRHKGRLVESCVFTKEKQAAIGIPPGIVPEGWWVGYKIDDSDAWAKIKSGEYQSFSIGGKGERTPVEKARRDYDQYPGYNEWLEENLDATIEDRKAAAAHYRENRSGSLAKSYAELRKANPYHDARGRFTSKSGGAGKPAASELESKIFGRSAFSEIAENETVREIVDDGDYETYGIRIQEQDTEIVGEMMSHRSSNWGGDFEDDPERAGQGGELDGVSAIDIDMVKHTPKYGGYSGKVAYLLGTNEWAEDGYDSGEKVMPEPRVLAKLGYKSGKLFVIESVKDGNDGVSKSYADLRKFNPYHDSLGRFSSANSAVSFTYAPGKSKAHDKAIERENRRTKEIDAKNKKKQQKSKISRKENAAQKTRDFIRQQTDVDIDQYHSDTTRRFDNSKITYVDWEGMNRAQRRSIEGLQTQYGGSIKLHDGGAWMKGIERLKKSLPADGNVARNYAELRKGIDLNTAAEKGNTSLTYTREMVYNKIVAKTYDEMRKFNPYHDSLGRFSSANNAASFTIRTRDPKKQYMADAAVQREKERNKKPEVNFTPAKSKREAVAYAKDKLGFAKVSYGTKMDLETINHVNEQITKIQAAYPETKGAVQELKTSRSERALAITRTYANSKIVLELSSQAYGNGLSYIREQNQRMSESGWSPKSVREGSTIWHEYGHVLASIETKKKIGAAASEEVHGPEAVQFITSRRARQVETKWAQDAASNLGVSVTKLAEGVSRYATAGGVGELFAEAFSEVNTSPSPRPEAMAVVKASGLYRG